MYYVHQVIIWHNNSLFFVFCFFKFLLFLLNFRAKVGDSNCCWQCGRLCWQNINHCIISRRERNNNNMEIDIWVAALHISITASEEQSWKRAKDLMRPEELICIYCAAHCCRFISIYYYIEYVRYICWILGYINLPLLPSASSIDMPNNSFSPSHIYII